MLTSCVREDLQNIIGADLPWSRFKDKRILVTGASGFLPGYFVETLLALSAAGEGPKEVVGLVRDLRKAQIRFMHHRGRSDFLLIERDLCLPLVFAEKFHFIIHAASQASPKFYLTDPIGTLKPNAIGTYHLLERARSDQAEGFLFISSGEVYGQSTARALIEESDYGYLDPTTVRSCYAESKRLAENLCVSMHHQFGLPTYIARPFHTYGPGIAMDDGRVFADFIADIIAGQNIRVKGDGTARRAFCYVSDAITGLFTILLKGEVARPYNVGNDNACVSIGELANTLAASFPERGLKVVFDAASVNPSYSKSPLLSNCPSVNVLRELGWNPYVAIEEGFRRTVSSIEELNAASC